LFFDHLEGVIDPASVAVPKCSSWAMIGRADFIALWVNLGDMGGRACVDHICRGGC